METYGNRNTYSATEVCLLAGISYRMLDYWIRLGKVRASVPARGSGTRRRFTAEDVEAVRRLVRAREVLRRLRGDGGTVPRLVDAEALAAPGKLEAAEEVLAAAGL